MMVRTSMDVDIYNVSIHDWANNRFRTTSGLPAAALTTVSTEIPMPGRLPDKPQTPEDDI
jgi:hypothetical protein